MESVVDWSNPEVRGGRRKGPPVIGDAVPPIPLGIGFVDYPPVANEHGVTHAHPVLAGVAVTVGVNPGIVVNPLRHEGVAVKVGEIDPGFIEVGTRGQVAIVTGIGVEVFTADDGEDDREPAAG